jgi:ATP-dependent Lon protease
MYKAHREYYLRQQLKAMQKELGGADTSLVVVEDYRQKIDAAKLPEEARQEALRELVRLQSTATTGP